MSRKFTLFRIDPIRQAITPMSVRLPMHPEKEFKRIIRATGPIGERTLYPSKPVPLMVAAQSELPASSAKWRLKGGEDTNGISLLYGNRPPSKERTGGIDHCPVDVQWLASRIVWTPAESDEDCAARAETLLPLLNDEIRGVIAGAQVMPTGEIWIGSDDHQQFGTALANLDLVGDGVRSQRLNRLGQAVFDRLTA